MAYISQLGITGFRNLADLKLELPPGVVVLFGGNAQGKTALLEAVYILAIARSFRAENEREVVNFQTAAEGGMALVNGQIESGGQQLRVYVGYQTIAKGATADAIEENGAKPAYSVRKQIRVSRVKRTAAELIGQVNAVLFSAEDIELVQGPPSGRRRFLDILLSQADPLYVKSLQRYQRVVQQRNQLLRLLREGRAQGEELAFWDAQLVAEGAWITWRRKEALAELAPLCVQQHRELGGLEGDLAVSYRPSVPLGDTVTCTEERFRDALGVAHGKERATAVTAVGPHRDDFDLMIEQVDMGIYASRGQARTLALTLKLAEAAYLTAARAGGPIVLLDDVLSEMDSSRRDRVLGMANQYQQALITTTDVGLARDHFGNDAAYLRVEAGVVSPVSGLTLVE